MKVKNSMDGGFGMGAIIFLDHLPGGLAAAVMAPAWWAGEVADCILPGSGMCGFTEEVCPGLEGDDDRIERADIAGEAIFGALFFRLKSSEDPVPYDQYTAVIFIQVFQVDAMVNPVVRWGIKNKFHGAGQAVDRFRVDPELVNEADGLHHQDDDGMEAGQRHPAPENKGACKVACPGLAQCGCQVISFGRVVY